MSEKSENRICQNCKEKFVIEPDDFGFYEKIKVPPPTFCPECRLIRRLAWRNEKSLFKNECKKCGEQVISVFPKDSGVTVYCRPCWWSDSWDGLEWGINFDNSKNFFSQIKSLLYVTPLLNLFGSYTSLINSEYTNMVSNLKNCYMITHSDYSENCFYGSVVENCKDSVDNTMLNNSQLCCGNVDCQKCYQAMYSVDCADSHNIFFCKNCVGCSDCLGCVNLRNQKYQIYNKSYSKEEYYQKIKEMNLGSYENVKKLTQESLDFWSKFPQKYMHERQNLNVSGDYIYNSKNTHNSFIATDIENSKFCSFISAGSRTAECYDFTHWGESTELSYECMQAGGNISNIKFGWYVCSNTSDMEYSVMCIGCQDCFGCVGLKRKQYCILNKQYTKEEYEEIMQKIKDNMDETPYVDSQGIVYKYGEFFPIEISPLAYNITTAQEFFPLTKENINKKGYRWKEAEDKNYKIDILPENLPDSIDGVGEEILSRVIGCEHGGLCNEGCATAFKIIPEELQFYKRMNLSLPRLCSNCRHYQRNNFRNPLKLWHRKCMKEGCENEFETSFAPEKPDIVYCDSCYKQEVY